MEEGDNITNGQFQFDYGRITVELQYKLAKIGTQMIFGDDP